MSNKRALSVERLLQYAYAEARVRGLPSRPLDDEGPDEEAVAPLHREAIGLDLALDEIGLSDARKIDLVVSRFSKMTRHLLRDHAIARTQPDWKPKADHRMAPMRWVEEWIEDERGGRGWMTMGLRLDVHPQACTCGGVAHVCAVPQWSRPAWRRGERCRPDGHGQPCEYCPIVEVDRPHDVQQLREQRYVRWWSGLEVIRDYARVGVLTLVDHVVTEELPKLTPWLNPPKILAAIIPR